MVRDIRVDTGWEREKLYLPLFANGKRKIENKEEKEYAYICACMCTSWRNILHTRAYWTESLINTRGLSRRHACACLTVAHREGEKHRVLFRSSNRTRSAYGHFHEDMDRIVHPTFELAPSWLGKNLAFYTFSSWHRIVRISGGDSKRDAIYVSLVFFLY